MKRIYLVSLVAFLTLGAAGCHRKATVAGSLEMQPRSITLPYPQLTTVHLTWSPSTSTSEGDTPSEPLVFLHLLGAKGQVLRTFDHPFPQHWAAGTPVSYDVKIYQSALAPSLDPGKYRLSVGLYDQSGKRWALGGLGEPIARQEYVAAELEVPPQPPGPRFEFSPAWLPLEAGSDKQVVARRWLADQPGEIRVQAIPGPGTLWLSFRIPPGDGANEKLVYHETAANTPAVVVRSTCGAVETGISGPGRHDVEMPVDAPGADGACRISLAPNFHILATEGPPRRSVSLEVAAWIAGAAGTHGGGASSPAATSPAPPPAAASPAPAPPAAPPPHTP
ncbi:MAG TPA: hypothetical protein VKY89_13015 [Thermoanaerobaculia bacterium]|jgi:hypothetical protein|nr:hypothetical protein [Thermoanaerobaculia bacterium]